MPGCPQRRARSAGRGRPRPSPSSCSLPRAVSPCPTRRASSASPGVAWREADVIATFDAVATGTDIQRRIGVKTSRDEPLARFTTMRVGGPADLFAVVHNPFELRALVKFARSRAIPYTLLGRGSDIVIADAGIRVLVI